MPANFPPQPVFPDALDSDYTLFLVYNTAETVTTSDNQAWSDEIHIKPKLATESEVWADNGFANIGGELFYYDSVEKNGNGKVIKLKDCIRNLGGTTTKYNRSGTEVRGFVVAEHHNQIVDAIINIEEFIGAGDCDNSDTLICCLDELDVGNCLDDGGCPDVQFDFIIDDDDECIGTTITYDVSVVGTFTTFRLDFGDGTSTSDPTSGTKTYAPGSVIDPVVTVANSLCEIVVTGVERSKVTEPTPETPDSALNIPTFDIDIPTPVIGDVEVREPDLSLPPIMSQCFDLAPVSISLDPISIGDIDINIPSLISVIVPEFDPISVIPPVIPPISFSDINVNVSVPTISFGPLDFPSEITFGEVEIPDTINFGPVDIPTTITVVPPLIPTVITFGPANIPSQITISGDIPNAISIVGSFPDSISVSGNIPDTINIVGSIPNSISITGNIPDTINITGDIPDTISVSGNFPDTINVTDDIPDTINVVGNFPDTISIVGDFPDSISIAGDFPDSITVDWGTPPTLTCDVNVTCPTSSPMAFRDTADFDPYDGALGNISVDYGFAGIPSEIQIKGPVDLPSVKIDAADIPLEIKLLSSDIPSEIKITGLELLPNEIKVAVPAAFPDIKVKVEPATHEPIKIDWGEVPKLIEVVGLEIPSTIKIEHDIPSVISVEGIPDTVRVEGFPDHIPLVYKGDPLEFVVKVDMDKIVSDDGDGHHCFRFVPCK